MIVPSLLDKPVRRGFLVRIYLFFLQIEPISKARKVPAIMNGKAESKKIAIKSSLYRDNTSKNK